MRTLLYAEVVFAAAFVVGVYLLVNLGAALMVAGGLGVVSCEWTLTRLRAARRTT